MENNVFNEWKYESLGNYIKVRGGKAFKSKDFKEQGVPILRISNIKNNGIDLKNCVYADPAKLQNYSNFLLENGNIVIAMSGATTGKTGTIQEKNLPLLLNQRVGVFEIQDNTIINQRFLKYVIASTYFQKILEIDAIGGAQPNISPSQIESIHIYIPPINEQQKIASILSSVDETIEKTEDVIDNLNLLEKGLMQKLLMTGVSHTKYKDTPIGTIPENWQYLIIDDVVKFEGGSQPPRDTFIFEPKEGYTRLIQIRDYKTDKYSTYVPSHLAKKFCDENDVMIGRYGPPIFQILRGLNGAYNVALIKAIPNEDLILQDYMYYVLLQEKLFRLIERLSQRTSGQTGIDMEALKNFPLPLPPIEEQQKIVSILNHNRKKIHNEEAYVKYLKKLKTGLMQQLLTGKVRVPATESEEVPQ